MKRQNYRRTVYLLAVVVTIAACRQQMADQPRYDPLEASSFFADGLSARAPVEGTVARGQLRDDAELFNGGTDKALATDFPFPITIEVLHRGRERYDIYCTPCHDRIGTGNGMIVRRGYARPPSYHTDILRRQPVGHFFRVISRGMGAMPSYSSQISAADRWAIIAYIRSLQLSQNAALGDVPPEQREQIDKQK